MFTPMLPTSVLNIVPEFIKTMADPAAVLLCLSCTRVLLHPARSRMRFLTGYSSSGNGDTDNLIGLMLQRHNPTRPARIDSLPAGFN